MLGPYMQQGEGMAHRPFRLTAYAQISSPPAGLLLWLLCLPRERRGALSRLRRVGCLRKESNPARVTYHPEMTSWDTGL